MAESSTPTATDGDGAKAGGAPADGRAAAGGPVVGEDGLARTPWAYGDPPLLTYYDTEWGLPVRDESGLFERLSLEGFQAGLSWLTILRKRERFREVFAGFDAEAVAGFGDTEIEAPLSDPGIIRHRGKIEACIGNAQAILEMRSDGGIADFIWSFQPADTPPTRDGRRGADDRTGIRCPVEGAEEAGLPVRRADDDVRAHGGHRHGRHAPHRLSPSRRLRGLARVSAVPEPTFPPASDRPSRQQEIPSVSRR